MSRSTIDARSEQTPVDKRSASPATASLRRRGSAPAVAALALVAGIALNGCSGLPDASGQWEGTTEEMEGESLDFEFDLDQGDDGDLGGRVRLFFPDEEPVSTAIDGGQVREDGSIEARIEQQSAFETFEIVWDGELDGDQMSGNLVLQGENLEFAAERISEAEAEEREAEREEARQDEREAEREAEEQEQRIAARVDEVEELDDEIRALIGEPDDEGYTSPDRLAFLEHADGELLAALGDPDAPERAEAPDAYYAPEEPDCDGDTLCAEAEGREQQLADDREDLEEYAEEERAGDYHLCDQAINYSYWQPPEDVVSGATGDYQETRSEIEDAREKLPGRFENALSIAREREEAAALIPEDESPELSYTTAELEEFDERAGAAVGPSEEALEQADTRRAEYEARVVQVTDEADTLYEAAGCDD